MDDTIKNTESQLDNEGLEYVAVHSTENNELTTTESVARQLTEHPVENVNTEEEMDFYDLTIPGDYSDYGIFDEEK